MLIAQGHDTRTLIFENAEFESYLEKFLAIPQSFYNWKSAQLITDAIALFNPDIIHVHNFFFKVSPAVFLVSKKMKIPIVATLLNYRLTCANALLLRNNQPCELCVGSRFPIKGVLHRCYRNSYGASALVTSLNMFYTFFGLWKDKVDRYIVLTDFAKQLFLRSSLSIPASKFCVKPNFTKDLGEGTLPRTSTYLFVGRLVKEKGCDCLLEAFSTLPYDIDIVGDGPEEEHLKKLYGSNLNIRFLGQQSGEVVRGLMKSCKALIFPSVWYEGLPFTIIEAFSAGTPVIASKLGAMEELISDGYNGFHFEPGDADNLKQVVQKFELVKGPRMYHNARESFLSKFTGAIHYKQIIEIYETLIKEQQQRND